MRPPAVGAACAAAAVMVALAGCGSGAASGSGAATAPSAGPATVLAAASLAEVLPAVDPGARYAFGGSDQLAFQVRQGAPADVYASASTRYPRELHRDGLVRRPVVFARNTLTVVVPASNPAGIRSVRDLARPGVSLVVGDTGVPVGAYTATMLTRLGLGAARDNVVSREPDVRGIIAKVALGEADAGVVYRTDARAAGDRVRALPVPDAGQPAIEYAAAVTTAARDPRAAERFVARLRGDRGRRLLARYGFTPVPGPRP
jgi:molybdate transport system substrate-binding protein